jgi:hypothetical protein
LVHYNMYNFLKKIINSNTNRTLQLHKGNKEAIVILGE